MTYGEVENIVQRLARGMLSLGLATETEGDGKNGNLLEFGLKIGGNGSLLTLLICTTTKQQLGFSTQWEYKQWTTSYSKLNYHAFSQLKNISRRYSQ